MRGAIVSLDRADPPGSWRWGGPDWTGKVSRGARGRVVGVTVDVTDPSTVSRRWSEVLGSLVSDETLVLSMGYVAFADCTDDRDEGLTEIAVEVPSELARGRESVDIGGVRFRFFPWPG